MKRYLTSEAMAALKDKAANRTWEGAPSPGTLYAVAKVTGLSISTLHLLRNGLPIGDAVAQKIVTVLGTTVKTPFRWEE